jgi:TolA-binding protein
MSVLNCNYIKSLSSAVRLFRSGRGNESPCIPCFISTVLILMSVACTSRGADAETRALESARSAYDLGFYPRAENGYSNFVVQFPASAQLPQAILYQARSALKQARYKPAADILTTNVARAGNVADEFQYWLGKVQFDSGQLAEAADTFGKVSTTFTNSALRLNAVLGEAEARMKLRQWPQTVALIDAPDSVFQKAVAGRPAEDPLVFQGRLFLAEALFEDKKYGPAEQVLQHLTDTGAKPELRWQRQLLLCQIQFANQRLTEALAGTSNLLAIATSTDPGFRAASVALQGDLLQALGRPADAIKAFEANLTDKTPSERKREAFFRIVEIELEQNRFTNAIARLEAFVAESPAEAASDVVLLSIGELRLKQYHMGSNTPAVTVAGATNGIDTAVEYLGRLIQNFPNSPLVPKARLALGWALLDQGKSTEAAASFKAAADSLALSEAQAVARFKLADLQFAAGNATNAVENYRAVITNYEGFPRVQRELVDRALYQMLHASIAAKDRAAAAEAVRRIVAEYPLSPYTQRSILQFGLALTDNFAEPAAARKLFGDFLETSPQSPLVAEVRLAVACTYEREKQWSAAATEYAKWSAQYPTNENLARAEFFRAVATAQAGQDTNALNLFTNFVARFPTNSLAARAQDWVGDYYYNRGVLLNSDEDLREAELKYQDLFGPMSTNWPQSTLKYTAQLKAGRAAYYRQSWKDAVRYFTDLLNKNDPACPPSVLADAAFAYGDTYRKSGTNALDRFTVALSIFSLIPQNAEKGTWPNDAQVPRAWGAMADCYFQIAGALPTNDFAGISKALGDSLTYYRMITNAAPLADKQTVALAHMQIAKVLQLQQRQVASTDPATATALVQEALNHYLDVIDARTDEFWMREAALAAGKICETRKDWAQAIAVYTRVAEIVPALKVRMEQKANAAREQQSLQK